MASKKKKEPAVQMSSDKIAADISAFLQKGGQIEEVPRGVSGNTPTKGSRSITLSKR